MACNSNSYANCYECKQDITDSSCKSFCIPQRITTNGLLSYELELLHDINYGKFLKFNRFQCRRNASNSLIPGICDQHAQTLNLNYFWNALGTPIGNKIFGFSDNFTANGNDIKIIFAFLVKLPHCKRPATIALMESLNIPIQEFIKIVFSPLGFHIMNYEVILMFMILILEQKVQTSFRKKKNIPVTLDYGMFANLLLRWIPWFEDGQENVSQLKLSKADVQLIKWNKVSKLLVGALVSSSSDIHVNILPTFKKGWQMNWKNKYLNIYSNLDTLSGQYWNKLIDQIEESNLVIVQRSKIKFEPRIITIGDNIYAPFCTK